MKRQFFAFMLFLFLPAGTGFSQVKNPVSLNGYVTTMQSSMFEKLSGSFMNENLLHNRLNFKAYISNGITFSGELRNRLFTGDFVRMGSYYSDMIGYDRGFADMSWNILSENSFLFNSTIDRLNVDFLSIKFRLPLAVSVSTGGRPLSGTRLIFSMPIHFLTSTMSIGPEAMQSGFSILHPPHRLPRLPSRLIIITT